MAVLLSWLLHAVNLTAQPICDIRHYSFSDGLSQSVVQRIVQSSDGLLWFCTWDGLCSYDGNTFTSYNMSSTGGKALSTNRIINIGLGKDDDIWCQTYDNRLFLFDREKRTFIDVLATIEAPRKQELSVKAFHVLPKGVVWVTTHDGQVFRIDGQAFKEERGGVEAYGTDEHPLKSNGIYLVYEDHEGDEWLLTHKGIDVVGKKQAVHSDDTAFRNIRECGGKFYLISTTNRLYVYRPRQGDFKQLNVKGYVGGIHALESLGSDTLVLQTSHSLTFYSGKGRMVSTFRTADIGREKVNITQLHIDPAHCCWLMLGQSELVRLNPFTLDARLYRLPELPSGTADSRSRNLLFTDRWGTLWAIPEHGALCYYDDASDSFRPYLLDANDPSSFYTPVFLNSTTDKQGNLWLALDRGVERLFFLPHFFTFHAMERNMDTRAFLADNAGRLWTSSKSGVVRVRLPEGQTLYLSPEGTLTRQKCTFVGKVYAMLQTRDGDIWLGTRENGLYRLQRRDNNRFAVQQYKADEADPWSLSSNRIFALYEDSRGHIWVGTFGGGLNLAERRPDGSMRFIHGGNGLKGFPRDAVTRVRCLAETSGGVLLVGSTNGLLACRTSFTRPEEAVFRHHKHIAGDSRSLSGNDVMGVFAPRGNEDKVCCLSFSGGLNIVSPDSLLQEHPDFQHYTAQDGLISNLVHTMVDDGKGHYWIAAENGLSCLDPFTGQSVNYPSNRFRSGLLFSEAVPLAMGDTLFFGTNQGVLELNLSRLPRNTYVPPVLFTEMSVQGRPLVGDVNRMETLVLSPSQRNISFHFTALDFVSSSTIQYAYRLRGLEENWNKVGNTHSASYMHLPVGEYTLEVRSTNSDGVWMDNVHSLRLVVKPRFSETAWAWVLYAALFVLLVSTVCYVLFYIYRLRHRIDMEQQMTDIKLRFFTDISHELRTPLTLISAPVDEVLRSKSLSEKDRANLSLVRINTQRMLRMISQILDFRKLQGHKMKLLVEEADLIDLLRQVMAHFRPMADEKHIDFGFRTPVEKLPMWLDVDKVEKVFFNLLSNAFKYTPAGRSVFVEVKSDDAEVHVSVTDSGIGIDEEHRKMLFQRFESFAHSDMMHPSSGIGLSLVKEMVDMHHGRINVDSSPGKGSSFTVSLPLDRAVYEKDERAEFILNDSTTATPAKEPQPVATPDDERPSVLVVEDNDELRHFLSNILSESYSVLEASNGQQGLELAVEYVPDMIITDVMMPVMDGMEMVKHVKADHRICHIPIVVLSAKASLDDRIKGLEHGIDDYLPKPFSSAYLKTRIASLLRQRKELQELYMARLQTQPASETDATRPELEPYDDHFMEQVVECIEQNMCNADFEIERLAEHLNMCRTVFYRKLKSITGLTPVAFVSEIRLKRALQLMERDDLSISQVAYMTGFKSPKYFSTLFKKAVGCTPSEYREKKGTNERKGLNESN